MSGKFTNFKALLLLILLVLENSNAQVCFGDKVLGFDQS